MMIKKIFKPIVFQLCLALLTLGAFAQTGNFKLLDYNVLHGFEGDTTVRSTYVNWVKKQAPAIVTYEEMINFSAAELTAFAKKYGHGHSVIMSRETGLDVTHPLAITSKYPIKSVKMVLDEMWHGYLYAHIENVHVYVLHLAPFTLKDRQKDIQKILDDAAKLPVGSNVVIAGDFNSLAEIDSPMYGKELLASMTKIEGRLEPKSGTPIVKNKIIYRNNLNQGKIDYSVMAAIKNAGYVDSFYAINKNFKNSVPTKAHQDKNSKLRRIDYIWLNPAMAKKLVASDIIHDEITDKISDHYPIFITLDLK